MEHGGISASELDSRVASLWPPMLGMDAPQYIDFMRRRLAQTYPAGMPYGYGRTPAPAATRRRVVLRPQYGVTEFIDRHGVARVLQRGGGDHDDGNGRFGAVPAAEAAIARLPLATAGELREKSCAVCLESFEGGEVLRMMPCPSSHGFHESCIFRWLRVSRLCPLCRFPLMAETV